MEVAVGQRCRLQGGSNGGRAEAHGPWEHREQVWGLRPGSEGCQVPPTLWMPQSKLVMRRCSSRKALPWRPLNPDLLLTRLLMLLSCL